MNEIRLLYFGSVSEISNSLLRSLKIVEFRPVTAENRGFFIIETKYGQESFRPVSLDPKDDSGKDILIYRYLPEEDILALRSPARPRRILFLLHNFLNLEYITTEIKLLEHHQVIFLVDTSNDEYFKSVGHASRLLPAKNFYRLAKVKNADKEEFIPGSTWNFPLYFLILVKFLINPVNEIKRLALIAKHSNLRILSRLLELVLFFDFVLRALLFHTFRMLGIRLFYRSAFFAGILRVLSIKGVFFLRHVMLMTRFKAYGAAIDASNLLVRVKDSIVTNVYYRTVHRFYFSVIHKMYFKYVHQFYFKVIHKFYFKVIHKFFFMVVQLIHLFYFKVIHKFYYKVVHRFYFAVIHGFYYKVLHRFFYWAVVPFYYKVIHRFYFSVLLASYYGLVRVLNVARYHLILVVRYKIPHFLIMSYYKFYGLCYDTGTFVYRFSKLILFYPFRKAYWFSRFQYEKRLKKFLV